MLIRDTIVSEVYSLRAYQKCINTKDLSLHGCINICQAEDAIRMQEQECRPESVNSIQSTQTIIPVHRPQHSSKQSSNFNRPENKTAWNCYYCGAPNWTREHSKVCKAKNSMCCKCGKKGHLDSLCRSNGTPIHMLEAQDYSHPQSQESPQDLLPESRDCTILYTILDVKRRVTTSKMQQPQDSRLGANEQSEHIQPAWITQSQNSKKHQVNIEIDTGTGCNIMPLYKPQELFGQE